MLAARAEFLTSHTDGKQHQSLGCSASPWLCSVHQTAGDTWKRNAPLKVSELGGGNHDADCRPVLKDTLPLTLLRSLRFLLCRSRHKAGGNFWTDFVCLQLKPQDWGGVAVLCENSSSSDFSFLCCIKPECVTSPWGQAVTRCQEK